MCWCWDNLRPVYPGLLLAGREQMPFDEAVSRIKGAKRIGWGQQAERLKNRSEGTSK
jgi:hypothetical protein